jgi:hypothetical protein
VLNSAVKAQNFPLDENGKINFWEVVKTDSLKIPQLYLNAKNWIKESGYKIVEDDSLGGIIKATQKFGVYDKGYISKKLHGKISYQLIIELKETRYRYQFNQVVFDYYKEDRNYNFSPTGKQKLLEDKLAKGWQNLWDNHRSTAFNTISQQVELFKNAMIFIPKLEEAKTNNNPSLKTDW